MEDLEAMLNEPITTNSDKLYVNADVDVTVTKAEQMQMDLSEQMQLDLEEDNEEVKEEKEVLVSDSVSDGEEDTNKETETEERPEMTKAEFAAKCKSEAMTKLGEFETLENKKTVLAGDLAKAQQELEMLFSKVRAQNIDLINKINSLTNELETTEKQQDKVKEDLLPLQRDLFLADESEKTLVYNKIQSTFVAATEKNQFDLKKFREEQKEFWKENLEILKPYAKITDVAAYLKITIKK